MKFSQSLLVCLLFLFFATGVNSLAAEPTGNGAKHVPASINGDKDAKLIAQMASDDPRMVLDALDDLQDETNPGTNVIIAARKLLLNPLPVVRRKAARALGAIHAPVDKDDLKAICRMLKSYDEREADDALKALRGLKASETIPEITPLLKSPHDLLVRDACRTLAVLGNTNQIPLIEPLLKNRNEDVRNDAQAAITALRAKN